MTEPFTFSVFGTPRPQPRPRFVGGRVVSTGSAKAKLWRTGVERAAKAAVVARGGATPLFAGAVRVRMVFTFCPPLSKIERVGNPHTLKPDVDNLAKAVLDVMENVGIFDNDSQVAHAPPEKWWGDRPGVAVVVESMTGETREDPLRWSRKAPGWLA